MNMDFKMKLPFPRETKAMYPLDEETERTIEKRVGELKDIISGKSITDACLGWEKTERMY